MKNEGAVRLSGWAAFLFWEHCFGKNAMPRVDFSYRQDPETHPGFPAYGNIPMYMRRPCAYV
jgi:hypothetical protein